MNDSVFIADLGDAGMQNHYHFQQCKSHCYHMSPGHVLSLKSPVNCIYHYLCISIHSEQNQSKKQQHGLDVQYTMWLLKPKSTLE